ncbi:hypothetical protein CCACVL1_20969 [Corchorus capsularis]|uniref:Uncharacterized protein n=1 Tax=Corchorus capsularis TaxID=210143 RepID=A0A1R3H923_COCAP|nr:hypothetical protein CCACVL1_20969 [Corchorus capsularis]
MARVGSGGLAKEFSEEMAY